MPTLPKGKQQMNVYITTKILTLFKELVKQKHNSMYGLSSEVEDAMKSWIKLHTHEHTKPLDINTVNPAPRIFTQWRKVRKRVEVEYGGDVPHQLPRFMIENAIIKELGSDRRTIRKYLKLFTRVGVIKLITTRIVEIVG